MITTKNNEITVLLEELDRELGSMKAIIESTASGWKSGSGDLYRKELFEITEEMAISSQRIKYLDAMLKND